MFLFISKKFKNNPLTVIHRAVEDSLRPYSSMIEQGNRWIEEKYQKNEIEEVYIQSKDSLKLHGIFLEHPNAKGIIIECHGYRSTAQRDLFASCFQYYEWGYSLLIIDQRTSHQSEGKYITFGIKESDDVIQWCEYIHTRFNNKPIILAGISMGASSVLMAVKDMKQEMNMKAVIADSAFECARDEVIYCINHYFHLPGKLFIHLINLWCKIFAGFSLVDKTVLNCISNSNIPILLIHGEDDDFVLKENSIRIYEGYHGKKELLIVPKANHGMGYLVDSKKYLETINQFLDSITG